MLCNSNRIAVGNATEWIIPMIAGEHAGTYSLPIERQGPLQTAKRKEGPAMKTNTNGNRIITCGGTMVYLDKPGASANFDREINFIKRLLTGRKRA